MLTTPKGGPAAGSLFRRCATFGIALLTTLTIIAPEWLTSIGGLIRFNFMAAIQAAHAAADDVDLHSDIKSITVMQSQWIPGYLIHLVNEYNVALTATAAFGAAMGVLRRNRWDMILAGLVIVFVGIMSLSGRTQPERYLLPIVPALWLLGARGIMALGKYRPWLPGAALAVVVSIPAFWLVR
jgi:hypothetical protein